MKKIIPFYPSAEKVLVKSEGYYQYDSDGKQYIDFESGVWCANIGHSHKRITEVIERQTKLAIHHGYKFTNRFAEDLSEQLLRITGLHNGSSVFLSSGSEAVNLAISLARHLTGRKKILKIDNTYLSAYGWGQISEENENIVNIRFNKTDDISNIDFRDISAFVLETGGASIDIVQFPEYEFVRKIVNLAKENNCMIIAEEVTTGMGRTGKWYGYQHYNIPVDIVVSGKALGNGFPISAITISNDVLRQFENKPFRYAQSHQNDPLGCAIALEVIKVIEEEKLVEASLNMGVYFKEQLERIKQKHSGKIKDIRGKGLMMAIELEMDIDGENIHHRLFENGIITGYKNNSIRLLPPLNISTTDLDTLVDRLDLLLVD
ncbi:class-III pyridoxal-phosphate-dependent aminotransferase [Dysgonomonas macrotermitis]|uniref:Acetylornithine aminotransferase n=1 Tax=Dysgonomonas macrotermitis TaxID=1346286 RepID=A0A1M4YRU7_9BACT|nr:aspartate aminotransferase family protein [Dysgonomonas macrotermitis]SHF08514.1 acetylornithine aminotransferase [Dysgonomonas macrotermitis]